MPLSLPLPLSNLVLLEFDSDSDPDSDSDSGILSLSPRRQDRQGIFRLVAIIVILNPSLRSLRLCESPLLSHHFVNFASFNRDSSSYSQIDLWFFRIWITIMIHDGRLNRSALHPGIRQVGESPRELSDSAGCSRYSGRRCRRRTTQVGSGRGPFRVPSVGSGYGGSVKGRYHRERSFPGRPIPTLS